MEKPTTKADLLKDIKEQRRRLENSFKDLIDADMVKSEKPNEWSVKDILAHVTAWEKNFLKWYETGLRGEKQVMPEWGKPGIIDAINQQIYEINKNRTLGEVLTEFGTSYEIILKTVEEIPEDDMFVPARYDWLGKNTLADYIIGNTSEHYAEHLAAIEAIKQKYGI